MSNRTKKSSVRVGAFVVPDMPDRTITFLAIAAGIIATVYVALVIVTVSFATIQTALALQVRDTEGTISGLETTYYASLARDNTNTPASAGLVAPTVVEYAVAKPAASLSFAGK